MRGLGIDLPTPAFLTQAVSSSPNTAYTGSSGSGVLSSITGWLGGTVTNVVNNLKGTGILESAGPVLSTLLAKKLAPAAETKAKAAKPAKPAAQPQVQVVSQTPKWVLPVAIGAGVLLLGGVALVALKKRS